jgi:hypothetical protein
VAGPLAAQDVRSLYVSRGATSDTSLLHVSIQYGIGTLNVQPATRPVLYEARLLYPADRSNPMATFDPVRRTLELGIKDRSFEIPGKDSGGELHVQLARRVPLDLSFKIGAAEATIRLGGLAVRRLSLKGGATETTLRFDSVNTTRMESMELKVGAAEFTARGLANARVDHITVEGAAGETDLSFDGTWTNNVTLDAKVFVGDMRIHVPPNVQVISTAKAMLGGVDDGGSSSGSDSSSDSSDSADDSDSDSDSADAAPKPAQTHVQPQPPPRSHVQGMPAGAGPTTYTLRVTGTATLGSLEILHDAH